MEVVLVDFDGTITSRDTTRALVFALLRSRPWRLPKVARSLWRLAAGGAEETVQRAKDECIGALLQGLSEAQLKVALQRYRSAVIPLMRPSLLDEISKRAAAGQRVLVVTASAELAVKAALHDHSVTVIGTRFAQKDGVFTGSLDGEGCYGVNKVPRIRAWVAAQGKDPRFIAAWSDSLSDLPMMNLANRRIWVCPENKVQRFRERDPTGEFIQLA